MKTHKNLFQEVCSFENLHSAYLKARKCKRYKEYVLDFSYNLEKNLFLLQDELANQTYHCGSYNEFIINDSKKRLIKAPSFRDRIVHHALYNIIEPIFDNSFIYDSYACRQEKGTHKAILRLKGFLKNQENIYCLQCDVRKFFESIDHKILLELIKKKIADKKVLRVIEEIIDSSFDHKTPHQRQLPLRANSANLQVPVALRATGTDEADTEKKFIQSLESWLSYARFGNSWRLRESLKWLWNFE